jgi:MoaA/NifB/PqqE/SkfB family radical SAM enzyme
MNEELKNCLDSLDESKRYRFVLKITDKRAFDELKKLEKSGKIKVIECKTNKLDKELLQEIRKFMSKNSLYLEDIARELRIWIKEWRPKGTKDARFK